jgi:hypothetical protein
MLTIKNYFLSLHSMKKHIIYLTVFIALLTACGGPATNDCFNDVKIKYPNADIYEINDEPEKYLIVDSNKVRIVYYRCWGGIDSHSSVYKTIMEVPQKHK